MKKIELREPTSFVSLESFLFYQNSKIKNCLFPCKYFFDFFFHKYKIYLDLENVLLDLLLHRIVGKLLSAHVEQVLELLIGHNLTTIGRVLEILLLDVLAELLGDVDPGNGLLGVGIQERGEIIADLNRLHKPAIVLGSGLLVIAKVPDLEKLVAVILEKLELLGNKTLGILHPLLTLDSLEERTKLLRKRLEIIVERLLAHHPTVTLLGVRGGRLLLYNLGVIVNLYELGLLAFRDNLGVRYHNRLDQGNIYLGGSRIFLGFLSLLKRGVSGLDIIDLLDFFDFLLLHFLNRNGD